MAYPAPRLYLRSPNSADQLGESVLYDLDPYSSVIDSEFLSYSGVVTGVGNASIKQHTLVPGSTTPGTTTTNPIFTTPGSSVFYIIARGEWATGSPTAPTDNLGNTITLASGPNPYSGFPTSDSAIYQVINNIGGNNHTATVAWGSFSGTAQDEATIAIVETIGANKIQAQSFIERAGAGTISSSSVTTTTPTLLLAVVMGTGNTGQLHTFNSTTGFIKITQASAEGDPDPNGYIQASVFYKYAPVAGTYTASFTTTASEGAQIYLLALENVSHGILGQTIGGPGLSATGTVPSAGLTGTLNQTLGVLTDISTGTIVVTGSSTPSMGALTDASTGNVGDTSSLSQTLGTLTSAASGAVSDAANASITLGSLTSTATGAISDTASLGVTLGTLGISATGTTTNTITGTLVVSMGVLTDSSTGTVSITGMSTPSLGALADTATGTITTHSALSQSLGSVSDTATGTVQVASTLSQNLGASSVASTGAVTDTGSFSASTGALGISATGTNLGPITGSLNAPLGALSLNGVATGNNTAAKLTRVMGALTATTDGTSNSVPVFKSLIEGDAVAVNNDGSTSHEIS